MSLKADLLKLLDNSIRLCGGSDDCETLKKILTDMKMRINEPLRVAVSGIMKAGKSTFMNALMGERLVYTGTKETTYTVCWFKYAKEPYITVVFRNGEKENAPFEDLEKWSVRTYTKENPRIDDVKYIMIYYPNEILKQLEFIDTPGLNSNYVTDAKNTLDFLAVRSSEETIEEMSAADAIIYAFQRSAGGFDESLLSAFKGNFGNSSPINSIGILTRTDDSGIWEVESGISPVTAAEPVKNTIMKNESMKRVIFSVFPVCAKQVEGFSDLDDTDWKTLGELAQLDKDELADLLFDAMDFEQSGDIPGSIESRTHIMESVGQYGIVEICRQLSLGKNKEQIHDILVESCGIKQVRDILKTHFGNRTFLIKSQFIFNSLRTAIREFRENPASSPQLAAICENIDNKIEELLSDVQTLNELRILQYYYNGQLNFIDDDEKEDFFHITGEYGREPEKRLNISETVSIHEMVEIARRKTEKWHEKASSFMMPNTYVDAAETIARSYEYILYHLSALCEE